MLVTGFEPNQCKTNPRVGYQGVLEIGLWTSRIASRMRRGTVTAMRTVDGANLLRNESHRSHEGEFASFFRRKGSGNVDTQISLRRSLVLGWVHRPRTRFTITFKDSLTEAVYASVTLENAHATATTETRSIIPKEMCIASAFHRPYLPSAVRSSTKIGKWIAYKLKENEARPCAACE